MASNIDSIIGTDSDDDAQLEEMRQAESPSAGEPPEDSTASADHVEEPSGVVPDAAGGEHKPTMVPYGALREERDRRQALEGQIAAQTSQIARLEETFQQVLQRAQSIGQTPEQVPDFDLDPDAYTKYKLETIEQKLTADEQHRQKAAEDQQKNQQAQQFLNMYSTAAREFAQKTPDAQQAYNYIITAMDNDLRLRGFLDPSERSQVLEREEEQIVYRAFQQGANPAQRIYELATARGYKRAVTEKDKLDRIAKTQDATSSLANVSGEGRAPPVTLARLAELDGDEFDQAFEKARKSGALG